MKLRELGNEIREARGTLTGHFYPERPGKTVQSDLFLWAVLWLL